MNHREILGVGANASRADIKKAFRHAAMEIHPDHSDSPEAMEAFQRIKEAHDALMKEEEPSRESTAAASSSAYSAAATAQMIYTIYTDPDMTPEELAHIQELDEKARNFSQKKSFWRRSKESEEVRRHRKKLKTTDDRIVGKY